MAIKKRIVVDTDHLPFRSPVATTWLMAISQTVWPIPGWALGVMWSVIALVWVAAVTDFFTREDRNPFEK